ncbi:Conserved_hypothetical protein [Hexamita inflata]|uniref:Uncharacterized protein n=2 Tax=Hexamita inflata TaxID=28002 RepID=A0AA86UYE0_9EUKA|nr:Conserved hypothetical protein [Hexamita inflata]
MNDQVSFLQQVLKQQSEKHQIEREAMVTEFFQYREQQAKQMQSVMDLFCNSLRSLSSLNNIQLIVPDFDLQSVKVIQDLQQTVLKLQTECASLRTRLEQELQRSSQMQLQLIQPVQESTFLTEPTIDSHRIAQIHLTRTVFELQQLLLHQQKITQLEQNRNLKMKTALHEMNQNTTLFKQKAETARLNEQHAVKLYNETLEKCNMRVQEAHEKVQKIEIKNKQLLLQFEIQGEKLKILTEQFQDVTSSESQILKQRIALAENKIIGEQERRLVELEDTTEKCQYIAHAAENVIMRKEDVNVQIRLQLIRFYEGKEDYHAYVKQEIDNNYTAIVMDLKDKIKQLIEKNEKQENQFKFMNQKIETLQRDNLLLYHEKQSFEQTLLNVKQQNIQKDEQIAVIYKSQESALRKIKNQEKEIDIQRQEINFLNTQNRDQKLRADSQKLMMQRDIDLYIMLYIQQKYKTNLNVYIQSRLKEYENGTSATKLVLIPVQILEELKQIADKKFEILEQNRLLREALIANNEHHGLNESIQTLLNESRAILKEQYPKSVTQFNQFEDQSLDFSESEQKEEEVKSIDSFHIFETKNDQSCQTIGFVMLVPEGQEQFLSKNGTDLQQLLQPCVEQKVNQQTQTIKGAFIEELRFCMKIDYQQFQKPLINNQWTQTMIFTASRGVQVYPLQSEKDTQVIQEVYSEETQTEFNEFTEMLKKLEMQSTVIAELNQKIEKQQDEIQYQKKEADIKIDNLNQQMIFQQNQNQIVYNQQESDFEYRERNNNDKIQQLREQLMEMEENHATLKYNLIQTHKKKEEELFLSANRKETFLTGVCKQLAAMLRYLQKCSEYLVPWKLLITLQNKLEIVDQKVLAITEFYNKQKKQTILIGKLMKQLKESNPQIYKQFDGQQVLAAVATVVTELEAVQKSDSETQTDNFEPKKELSLSKSKLKSSTSNIKRSQFSLEQQMSRQSSLVGEHIKFQLSNNSINYSQTDLVQCNLSNISTSNVSNTNITGENRCVVPKSKNITQNTPIQQSSTIIQQNDLMNLQVTEDLELSDSEQNELQEKTARRQQQLIMIRQMLQNAPERVKSGRISVRATRGEPYIEKDLTVSSVINKITKSQSNEKQRQVRPKILTNSRVNNYSTLIEDELVQTNDSFKKLQKIRLEQLQNELNLELQDIGEHGITGISVSTVKDAKRKWRDV